MDSRKVAITDGKGLLNLLLGAKRWELEKDEAASEEASGCVTKMNCTICFLLKNWNRIHGVDKAMGESGLTQDIADVKSNGYSVIGFVNYGRPTADGAARNYNVVLKVVKDE
jgi:hypothetical protein